jgi:hexosaminidase
MTRLRTFRIALLLLLPFAAAHAQGPTAAPLPEPPLLPRPARAIIQPGALSMTEKTVIVVDTGAAAPLRSAEFLADMISRVSPFRPAIVRAPRGDAAPGSIVFSGMTAEGAIPAESYALRVFPGGVRISASSEVGAFYAVMTLRQLLPARFESPEGRDTVTSWTIPSATVQDMPRFAWRGLLLDVCRHFMDVDFVKRTIDMLAMLKMNRLHWHLTEDQGWRIEIRKYPALTSVGAWRKQKDGSIYGGYYTQEQIRDVVRYAAERHVTVVPEIEMPGHALAALASYPRYSCTGGPFEVANDWGVFKDIYCAGKDETFHFLENVLTEVLDLFPSEYIHIGGDEAPKYRWEHCADCQRRIREEGLADEHALQSWFIGRIGTFLRERGRKLIGWDEILEGGLPEGATVQSWRGFEGAAAAARAKHHAIVSPTSHAYFDYDVATTDLAKVYSFDPIPPDLKPSEAAYILGGECNMWTEHAPQHLVESRLFPRILAMAEVLWSPVQLRDWRHFHDRVQRFYPRMDSLSIAYGYEAPPVRFLCESDTSAEGLRITLKEGQPGLSLRYTHGSDTTGSESFARPVLLRGEGVLSAYALGPGKRISPARQLRYDVHTAFAAAVTLAQPPSGSYSAGGPAALTDGIRGSASFRDGYWQGHEGRDIEAVIDLGSEHSIRELRVGFLHYQQAWIFLPRSVDFSTSIDGITFSGAGIVTPTERDREEQAFTFDAVLPVSLPRTRYVRVRAQAMPVCPPWHAGAGGKTWIFIDEIVVR